MRAIFLRHLILSGILTLLIVIVARDAVHGPHGLNARWLLEHRLALLDKQLASMKTDRASLEREAELLGAKAEGQPALLEAKARSLLDLAHPSDIVIIDNSADMHR